MATMMVQVLQEVYVALDIPEDRAYDRDVIAHRIIELVESGTTDAGTLRARLLAELGSSSSRS